MKIAIIGHGAIAGYVRSQLSSLGIEEVAQIVRPGKEAAGDGDTPPRISDLAALDQTPDLIVECGGHAALAAHGPVALMRGMDVLTVSVGALADRELEARLNTAARDGGAKLYLASGAIGGLDALRSGRAGGLTAVTYTGRKPPGGWVGSPAQDVIDLQAVTSPTVHFQGTARRAARDYPKNANVAAAVALAGIGLDDTQVKLIADPTVTTNIHEITAAGSFGSFHFSISGNSLPDNPRSSALAAMSVVAELAERGKAIGF